MTRVGCYARFSSDLQRDTSLEDQIATARTFAAGRGWVFCDDQVYTDAAMSGASLDRPGIRALRAVVGQRPLPFDVLLVDDSSRVSRDLADAIRLLQELRFAGVRLIYISQGIDSDNEQAETLVTVHGMVDQLYLREMRAKIRRGLAGQIRRGYATGSITFGYRTRPIPDPTGKTDVNGYPVLLGKRSEIVPDEARIVVRIFEMFVGGFGMTRIVEALNGDGLRGPRGRRWQTGAVRRVLLNERYCGRLIWGQRTFERRPGTKQLVPRPVPREQWQMLEQPELRIISDELWAQAEARRQIIHRTIETQPKRPLMRGRNAALHSRHLFSGFMQCATCGGTVVIVTGGYGSPRYGCLQSWRNGRLACSNRLTVRSKIADAYLVAGLRNELLSPATLTYVTDALVSALNRRIDERPQLLADAQTAHEQATQRLHRLIDAIEHGVPASTVAGAIAERQNELTRLEATLSELSEPTHQRLAVLPSWVQKQLQDLVGLLADAPERVKAEFYRLKMRVTMTPKVTDDGRGYYQADVVNSLPCLAGITEIHADRTSATDRLDRRSKS